MTFFSGLTFLNPWFLASLLAIPLLILLLRVIPPPPKYVTLSTARFLEKLTTQKRTSHKTPWWLLLLRALILICVIFAFAHPVVSKTPPLQLNKPVLLIIDNGWASAQNWSKIISKAEAVLRDAKTNNLTVTLGLTAPLPGQDMPLLREQENPATLKTFINGLSAQPWQGEEGKLTSLLDKSLTDDMDVVWLSSGVMGKSTAKLYNTVKNYNSLIIYRPDDSLLPVTISNDANNIHETGFIISRVIPAAASQSPTLLEQSQNGNVLYQNTVAFSGNALSTKFERKADSSEQPYSLKIAGQSTAASVFLLGSVGDKPYVGIASPDDEDSSSSFTDSAYYLTRALKPFAKIITGSPQDILEEKSLSVLILPDVSSLPVAQLDKLKKWIDKGGVLLRFAGPSTAQIDQLPVAVPMQKGERALGGDLTWENTQNLALFSENSPFYGIELHDNITLKKHILAKPEEAQDKNVWARLEDGIPFITARQQNRGLIIYIHTTADPAWSDLPLTGLYIDILRRILDMAERPAEVFQEAANGNIQLEPSLVLNAKGQLIKPSPLYKGFSAGESGNTEPNSIHPPGLYSYKGKIKTLNLANSLGLVEPITALGKGHRFAVYQDGIERDMKPFLLKLATLLFLLDWVLMMYLMRLSDTLRTYWTRYRHRISCLLAGLLLLGLSLGLPLSPAQAQNSDIDLITNIHLAYFETGDVVLDSKSQNGLVQLQNTLIARTSVEPKGVVAVDAEQDTLLFYPFIYWPFATDFPPLSDKAKEKIQSYINNGGLIIVDFGTPSSVLTGAEEIEAFLSLMEGINLPPLQQIGPDHTLRRSFYLLDRLYGRYDSENVWASYDPDNIINSVAGLIIGGNDWAGAWASGTNEFAMRTGINFTMYALTGNYKADQLHLPFILERLGQ